MQSKVKKTADRVYSLLREDLLNGKFRNGIRVDDIYLNYSVIIQYS